MMENILGLYLTQYGNVFDRFDDLLGEQMMKAVPFLIEENDKEADIIMNRWFTLSHLPEQQAYFNTLIELVKIDNKDGKFRDILRIALSYKKREGHTYLSAFHRKQIKLVLWRRLGNEIPLKELSENKIKRELKRCGYLYLKEGGGDGWYFHLTYVGKDWQEAFLHLESFLDMKDRREDFV